MYGRCWSSVNLALQRNAMSQFISSCQFRFLNVNNFADTTCANARDRITVCYAKFPKVLRWSCCQLQSWPKDTELLMWNRRFSEPKTISPWATHYCLLSNLNMILNWLFDGNKSLHQCSMQQFIQTNWNLLLLDHSASMEVSSCKNWKGIQVWQAHGCPFSLSMETDNMQF